MLSVYRTGGRDGRYNLRTEAKRRRDTFLRPDVLSPDAGIGDSIAVNGRMLTVVKKNMPELSFDLSGETLRITNLGDLKKGDRVNSSPPSVQAPGSAAIS